MGNFEKPDSVCEKCICSRCRENVANGKRSASCSGCATCNGTIDDCPLDLFQEN